MARRLVSPARHGIGLSLPPMRRLDASRRSETTSACIPERRNGRPLLSSRLSGVRPMRDALHQGRKVWRYVGVKQTGAILDILAVVAAASGGLVAGAIVL